MELGADDEFWDSSYSCLLGQLILACTSQSIFAPVPAGIEQHQFLQGRLRAAPLLLNQPVPLLQQPQHPSTRASMNVCSSWCGTSDREHVCVSPAPCPPLSQSLGTN